MAGPTTAAALINISGATNATYTTPPLTLANNGLQYQCVVTAAPCSGTTATSSIATVSVFSDNAEFLSITSGNIGDPNSWEESFDGGNSFNNPALYTPVDINSTNTVVQNGNTVTAAANVSLNHVVIRSSGEISVNTGKDHNAYHQRRRHGFGCLRHCGYDRYTGYQSRRSSGRGIQRSLGTGTGRP